MLKKVFASIFILAFFFGFSWADDRRTDKSVLVVMTLNAEFLWDGVTPEEGRGHFLGRDHGQKLKITWSR